jgi:hypothetical protein
MIRMRASTSCAFSSVVLAEYHCGRRARLEVSIRMNTVSRAFCYPSLSLVEPSAKVDSTSAAEVGSFTAHKMSTASLTSWSAASQSVDESNGATICVELGSFFLLGLPTA